MISTIWPTLPARSSPTAGPACPSGSSPTCPAYATAAAPRARARTDAGAEDGQTTGQDGTGGGQGGWAPTLTNGNAARRRIIVRKGLTSSKVALECEKSPPVCPVPAGGPAARDRFQRLHVRGPVGWVAPTPLMTLASTTTHRPVVLLSWA